MFPSLQSHGLTVKKWVPPAPSRFISYTESDEEWAGKFCGLGHYVEVPAPWYDVLHEDGHSRLGWVKWNPAETYAAIRIPIVDSIRAYSRRSPNPYSTPISSIDLTRREWIMRTGGLLQECFETWSCHPDDFGDMVKFGRAFSSRDQLSKYLKRGCL